MTKSKQHFEEYYANYETCRNMPDSVKEFKGGKNGKRKKD